MDAVAGGGGGDCFGEGEGLRLLEDLVPFLLMLLIAPSDSSSFCWYMLLLAWTRLIFFSLAGEGDAGGGGGGRDCDDGAGAATDLRAGGGGAGEREGAGASSSADSPMADRPCRLLLFCMVFGAGMMPEGCLAFLLNAPEGCMRTVPAGLALCLSSTNSIPSSSTSTFLLLASA